MISGRVALGGLSLEFGGARKRFDALAPEVRELSEEHARLLKEEEEILRELARVYLPELSPEAVAGGLAELRHELEAALRLQPGHVATLRDRIEAADRAVDEQQEATEAIEAEEARGADTLDERRARAQAVFDADEEYTTWVAEHEAVMEREEILRLRRSRLGSVGAFERRRYDEFGPFAYLRSRGYGGPDYTAGALRRRFDRWLARRVGYDRLARNYRILRDGPRLIHEEIVELRERARSLEAWIDEREARVTAETGVTPAATAYEEVSARLSEARDRLLSLRAHRDELVVELQKSEARKGAIYEEAIERHLEFLEGQTIRDLVKRARTTTGEKDERLLGQLGDVRERLGVIGPELTAKRTELERLADTIGELGKVKRTATDLFVHRRTHFPEEFRLRETLAPFLAGRADADHVMEEIERAHVVDPLFPPEIDLTGWLAGVLGHHIEIVHEMDDEEIAEADYVVYDENGEVVERRVTRPGGGRGV